MVAAELGLLEFSRLLSQFSGARDWSEFLGVVAGKQIYECECCGANRLSAESAAKVNQILSAVKDAGGPSPYAVYGHCRNAIFIDWCSEDRESFVSLDLDDMDAMVRPGGDLETYFVEVCDT